MEEDDFISNSSAPINIPNVKIDHQYTDDENMEDEENMHRIIRRYGQSPIGSSGDMYYDSPKIPRPSNDFSHVMVKLNTNMINMASSCPVPRLSNSQSLGTSGSDSSLEIRHHLESALSPSSGRRRPRRNVRFDEATITVTAELGESAAKFRSRWRQRHLMSASPPIKFGSKNISIQHDEDAAGEERIASIAMSPNSPSSGKSIFEVCNYTSYGRYT